MQVYQETQWLIFDKAVRCRSLRVPCANIVASKLLLRWVVVITTAIITKCKKICGKSRLTKQ